MRAGPAIPAEIYVDKQTAGVDASVRRALSVEPSGEAAAVVDRVCEAVRPDLEHHFGVTLATFEPPHYLLYDRDAFFVAHRDRPRAAGFETSTRQVSVVFFLNDDFGGGALTFYELLDGEKWQGVGLPCDAAPGLLVAFRSETLHEVQPITAGQRCTVATWFL
jgi:predicted 2-oxoglutarate/Fe(II)-dependent dioxygenase YbiX